MVKNIRSMAGKYFLVFHLLLSFIIFGTGFASVEKTPSKNVVNSIGQSGNISSTSDSTGATNGKNTIASKGADSSANVKLAQADTSSTSDKIISTQSSSVSSASSSGTGGIISVEIVPVGNTGAASTSIPIEVPPGRKGMAPNLSLNYNSFTMSNGWVGTGWHLDMGDIRKSGRTNVPYVFVINGSPVELITRSQWGAGYYGAKIEGEFTKYYLNSDTWEVTKKDGTKYYYGRSINSKQQDSNGTFKWSLDKVQDTNGNYMEITYTQDQGEIYPDRIDYTRGNGNDTGNYVKFNLESRTDINTVYALGSKVVIANRLRSIETFGNGQLSRRYILDYTYSPHSSRSLLSSVTVYGSDGTSALPPITFTYQTTGNSFQFASSTSVTSNPSVTGDFNGDGRTDFITCSGQIFYSKDSSFYLGGVWSSYQCSGFSHVAGDFNGDGKDDMLVHELGVPYPDVDLYVSTGTTFQYVSTSTIWTGERLAAAGDFNGDGKADFVSSTGSIYYSDGNQFYYAGNRNAYSSPTIFVGEFNFNGDGKDDILMKLSGSQNVSTYICKGDSFELTGSVSGSTPVAVGDFNGDRMTDFMDSGKNMYFSNGRGFNGPVQSQGLPSYQNNILGGDFNGDGKDDVIIYNTSAGTAEVYVSTGAVSDLLSTVNNGFGSTTFISYAPSTQYNNKFLPFVVQTVSSVTVNDGNSNSSVTDYEYSGGDYDYQDREFRGFEYVKSTDPNGTTTETWYKQDDIYKGLPYEQITKDSAGNIYARTVNTYQSSSPYTNATMPYLSQKDDYMYDGTTTPKQDRITFTYDSYGNVKRKYFDGDISITGDERDEYTNYYYDTSKWIISLPAVTCVKLPGATDCSGSIKARTSFTYYSSTGNLWKKESWLSGGVNPVITYTYDSYGNLETITDAKNNPPTTITYDTATHTYPWKITNALNHTIERTYDYISGKVLTEKDPNINTTTYQYDSFGRLKKVINPNDMASTYGTVSYYYIDPGIVGNQRVLAVATEQSGTANYIWTETYFDGLGRTIKTRSEGPDNKVIVTQTIYNERGLVDAESLPYFESIETPRWTTYEYDPIGKISKTTRPDGRFLTAEYLKGTLIYIDPNGHRKTEEIDIYGRTIKIEEYMGVSPAFTLYATTIYDYDVMGNLTKVTDAATNQTIMTYDTLGRKTSMTDPDMGYWTYLYDANGNLISQRDAKSQTIYFQYDTLNRLKQKDYGTQKALGSGDVVYTYDQVFSTNSKGRLTTVSDVSGTTKFYYDKLGRTTKTEKTVDSTPYTTWISYDSLGRTDTITYPDNTVVKYEYDTGGNISKVKNASAGTIYASYGGYNAGGQYGTVSFANGVTTQYNYYSQNNRLLSIIISKQTNGLINLQYQYDNVGNITSISDYHDHTKDRTLKYDDLNRLIEANSQAYGGNLVYQYDMIGNMTYNCRYGYYFYDPNHKHAVNRIDKNGTTVDTYSYDNNGNMTGGAGRTLTSYDYNNMPTRITDGSMTVDSVYDANGNRVKKIVSSSTTIYIGQHYECANNQCTKYIFAGSQRIAEIKNTGTYYYHTDHLGSSNVITDSSGNKVQEMFYYPFGELKYNSGSDIAKYKFTDQEFDGETTLYNYGARYYDPRLARFVSADTIVPQPFNPQSLNRYSYVRNNPLLLIDPDGHDDYYCCGGGGGGWGGGDPWSDPWYDPFNPDGDPYEHWGNGGGGNDHSEPAPPPPPLTWSPNIVPVRMNPMTFTGVNMNSRFGFGTNMPATVTGGISYRNTSYIPYLGYASNVQTTGYSINKEMYQSGYQRKNIDWVDATLAGVSSTSALVAIGASDPRIKLGAGLVGAGATGFSLIRTGYKYYQGDITLTEASINAALEVTPLLGKGVGKAIGKWINPNASASIDAAVDVLEHQKGLFDAGKDIFYDPNK